MESAYYEEIYEYITFFFCCKINLYFNSISFPIDFFTYLCVVFAKPLLEGSFLGSELGNL